MRPVNATRPHRLGAAAAVVVLAACGGGDDDAAGVTTVAAAGPSTGADHPDAAPGDDRAGAHATAHDGRLQRFRRSTDAPTSASATTASPVTTVAPVAGDTWRDPEGVFTVAFPAEPSTQNLQAPLPDGTSLPVTAYLAEVSGAALIASCVVYPEGTVIDPTEVLDAARDGALDNVGAELVDSEPIELQGRPGVGYRGVIGEAGGVLARSYLDDLQLCQVLVVGEPATVETVASAVPRFVRVPPGGRRVSRLTDANVALAREIIARYPRRKSALIPLATSLARAERVRDQGGDAPRRRAGRRHARRGVRHGLVLRDVPVRADGQVPDQHLRHDVVRTAGSERVDAPRRARARRQGREHHRRRADHAAAGRVPGCVHRGAGVAGELPPPLPCDARRLRPARRRPARRQTRRRDPTPRHARPQPPAHPHRQGGRRRPPRRCHRSARSGWTSPRREGCHDCDPLAVSVGGRVLPPATARRWSRRDSSSRTRTRSSAITPPAATGVCARR